MPIWVPQWPLWRRGHGALASNNESLKEALPRLHGPVLSLCNQHAFISTLCYGYASSLLENSYWGWVWERNRSGYKVIEDTLRQLFDIGWLNRGHTIISVHSLLAICDRTMKTEKEVSKCWRHNVAPKNIKKSDFKSNIYLLRPESSYIIRLCRIIYSIVFFCRYIWVQLISNMNIFDLENSGTHLVAVLSYGRHTTWVLLKCWCFPFR